MRKKKRSHKTPGLLLVWNWKVLNFFLCRMGIFLIHTTIWNTWVTDARNLFLHIVSVGMFFSIFLLFVIFDFNLHGFEWKSTSIARWFFRLEKKKRKNAHTRTMKQLATSSLLLLWFVCHYYPFQCMHWYDMIWYDAIQSSIDLQSLFGISHFPQLSGLLSLNYCKTSALHIELE